MVKNVRTWKELKQRLVSDTAQVKTENCELACQLPVVHNADDVPCTSGPGCSWHGPGTSEIWGRV